MKKMLDLSGCLILVALGLGRHPWAAASSEEKEEILVGAGDIAICDDLRGPEATARLLDAIPGTIFVAGDLAYPNGTEEEFARCYDSTWGRHKARTRPAPGNDDYHTPKALPYFAYFGGAAGDPKEGYYSYELGTWHIVVLNSNCSEVGGCQEGGAEEVWLRRDLALHRAPCTLAYWHSPLFSSGAVHGNDPSVRPFWKALYDSGAEIVVNGHDHDYERFAPQSPDGIADAKRGIREFVVGTGGRGLRRFGSPIPNSEVRDNSAFGVLKLTLGSAVFHWQFVPEAGKTFTDSGSGRCH